MVKEYPPHIPKNFLVILQLTCRGAFIHGSKNIEIKLDLKCLLHKEMVTKNY